MEVTYKKVANEIQHLINVIANLDVADKICYIKKRSVWVKSFLTPFVKI